MKKFFIVFISFLVILTVTSTIFYKRSAGTESLYSEVKQSMEESEKEDEKRHDVLAKVSKELKNQGYNVSLSLSNSSFFVHVPDEDFLKKNKAEIERLILNIAEEEAFHDADINFRVKRQMSKEGQKLALIGKEVNDVIIDILKEKGYMKFSFSVNIDPQNVIDIESMDEMVEEKDELEKRIKEAVHTKTNMEFNVTIKKRNKHEIKAQNWSPVFKAVREETKKEFKEYRGFAYSFHPEPLQIIIKTDLETSNWFWNPKVRRIEKYARAIIEVKRKGHDLEDIPYEVVIRDKDGKRIN